MSIGRGTKTGKELRGFIEEIESVDQHMKQLREAKTAIFAEAKAKGFEVKEMRRLIALRKLDPAKRHAADEVLATYMHAIGMDDERPLFTAVGKMAVDPAMRDEVIEALKQLAPATGDFIVRMGGTPIRIFRDADGNVGAEDVVEEPVVKTRSRAATAAADDEDEDETVYGGTSPTSRMVPKSHIQSVADRAEAASKARREREAKASEPAGTI
mgnify:FL=1